MGYTIFYSWQTDLPNQCNKGFIREAINDAVQAVASDSEIVDSPRVDSGMEGISGTPEVASIMFEKIDQCAIFIGDVSLVGTIPSESGKEVKRVPNPNVSLELGYAAARIGWERVVCVMNEHFGERRKQPFDVRNRRYPINYRLDPKAMNGKEKVKDELVSWFTTAITTVAQNELRQVDAAIARLDSQCLDILMSAGTRLYFHLPEPKTREEQLDAIFRSIPIGRLLDLRLLLCEQRHDGQVLHWAYHWTYLGNLVLKRLNILGLNGDATH